MLVQALVREQAMTKSETKQHNKGYALAKDDYRWRADRRTAENMRDSWNAMKPWEKIGYADGWVDAANELCQERP